jgi:AraC family transcriptional regulator
MKPVTRDTYFQRIDKVIAELRRCIGQGDELPDLADLAKIANSSLFHFHRIYRALTGETVGRTALRLRLVRALQLLSEPDRAVTDAALAVGYETPQAFARAFRDALGMSPSELRAQPERLADEMARLSRAPGIGVTDEAPLRVEVVSIVAFDVVAVRASGSDLDLAEVYGRLFAWAIEVGAIERLTGIYGLPRHDRRDTPPENCEFDCAVAFSGAIPAAPQFDALTIDGGDYARIRHIGGYAGLDAATDQLLGQWLAVDGHALRDFPIYHHYIDDPEQTPETLLRTDIYVPIEVIEEDLA